VSKSQTQRKTKNQRAKNQTLRFGFKAIRIVRLGLLDSRVFRDFRLIMVVSDIRVVKVFRLVRVVSDI
jgi:hypothetical protein